MTSCKIHETIDCFDLSIDSDIALTTTKQSSVLSADKDGEYGLL